LLRVDDVACGAPVGRPGAAEHAPWPALALVRRGVFRHHAAGDEVLADPGTVVVYGEGEDYRVSHPVPGGDACTVFTFDPERLAEAWEPGVWDRPAGRWRPVRRRFLLATGDAPAFATLRRVARRAPHDALAVEELGIELLAHVSGADEAADAAVRRAGTRAAHRRWVDTARLMIAEHLGDSPGVTELARAASCSPFHLAHVFRRHTGMPIRRYRTRLRLLAALERLAEGPVDLTTLAFELGFSSHSHFSAAFTRGFGRPPSRLRDPRRRPVRKHAGK
jgi:AraC-like DNA-binding protein